MSEWMHEQMNFFISCWQQIHVILVVHITSKCLIEVNLFHPLNARLEIFLYRVLLLPSNSLLLCHL